MTVDMCFDTCQALTSMQDWCDEMFLCVVVVEAQTKTQEGMDDTRVHVLSIVNC